MAEGPFMFAPEMIQSFIFLAVITVFICVVGVVLARKEDREAGEPHDSRAVSSGEKPAAA
jgi:hypothetical protein